MSSKQATKRGHSEVPKGINPSVKPSGNGCKECLATGGWWLHLRRCAECGHVGCCNSSPSKHAQMHYHATSHPIIQSFEPGEGWFYSYKTDKQLDIKVKLASPTHHPTDQPVPGGNVPTDTDNDEYHD